MAAKDRVDPYGESNPGFRRAYIRERLAANKAERDALAAERNEINDRLRADPAKVANVAAATPAAAKVKPIARAARPPEPETQQPTPETQPSAAAVHPPAPPEAAVEASKTSSPEPQPAAPKPEAPKSEPKKKTSIWRRKRS